MIDKVKYSDCCTCGNCINVCPKNAITFCSEHDSFLYPEIDSQKCIKCQKCEKYCPVLNHLPQNEVLECYAAKHKEDSIRLSSSSGGIFYALAKQVIEDGGIVYGAAFASDLTVYHREVDTIEYLHEIQGSKYVESDLSNIFNKINKQLECDQVVLFSGTPCQCAALRTYLKDSKKTENLIVVDFICHGILSRNLFKEYLSYLESKYKSKILSFSFRDKTYGWIPSGPKIVFENGKIKQWPLAEDMYMQGYFKGICMRESCYTCKYKNMYSGSDITLGDYWGAESLSPDIYDSKGVSIIVIQTPTGEKAFDSIKHMLVLKAEPIEKLTKYNTGLFKPFKKGELSHEYQMLSNKIGHFNALKTVGRPKGFEMFKRRIRRIKRKIIK